MAIEVSESQGNFYTMMGHDMRASVIVVETDRIDECIAEYVANGYTGVAIRPSSFQGEDLSVLLHFPNLL
ncbi:hypothetical protein [Marivivens marinus]|uniref:hypothetical protein n=1 Tax=Marivivens marinus TaxID=3110173 RepID=UPI003B849AF9